MCNISIIIPIYNGEEYLEECLKSVISQDVNPKEIICVDDGSTDRSVEIIEKFQKNCDDIKLIKQKNQGAAIARNAALDIAQGKYIAFMDADDFYLNTYALRVMIETCEQYQMPICGSFYTQIRDGEKQPTEEWRKEFGNKTTPKKFCYKDYQYDYHYQNYVFSREFINQHGLRFPNLRRYQDPPFFVQAMWNAKEFMIVPMEVYGYRLRTTAMKFSFLQMNDTLKGIMHNIEFAKKHDLWILYKNNVDRLNKSIYERLKSNICEGNMTALKLVLEIKACIDETEDEALKEEIKIVDFVKSILYENQFLVMDKYQFPFDKIAKGSKIAVYGAGVVGKEIVKKIQDMDYCQLFVWVDQNYKELQKQGFAVCNPDELKVQMTDYVLVAIEKESIFYEIKNKLLFAGWSENEIIGPIRRKGVV